MAGIKFPEPAAQNSKFNAVDLDVEGGKNAPVLHVDTNSEALTLASDADGSNPAITTGGDDMPVVPASNNHRVMSMTPLEPRTAGGLKGFGFTVSFDEQPVEAGGVQVPHRGEVA